MYTWIDQDGQAISSHQTPEDAGRAHRRHFRTDIRCINSAGEDVTDMVIVASIEW